MLIYEMFYLLFIITSLGVSVNTFKDCDDIKLLDFIESSIMSGLPVFVFLLFALGYTGLLYNHFSIFAAIILMLVSLIYNKTNLSKLKTNIISRNFYLYTSLVIIIIVLFFKIYHDGAFKYPYLEDTDPWVHATCVNYILTENTFLRSPDQENLHYLTPYPPIYSSLMAVVKQASNQAMQDVLKEINVFLISFGLLLAFFYFKTRLGFNKALYITFILSIIPCYMSHFIWAQTLAIILWFPSLYYLDKSLYEKNNTYFNYFMAMVCIASALTTQPSTGFIFGLFLIIYFLLNFYIQKGSTSIIYKQFALQSGGLILAVFLFWLPMIFLYGTENITKQIGLFKSVFSGGNLIDTSGGVIYSLRDFVFVTVTGNKIDQPVGIGTTIFVLLVIGVVFYSFKIYKQKQLSKENKVLLIWIVWFFFTLLGIQGNGLPIKLFPHRFWVYMALAIAVIVGCVLDDFTKFIKHNKKTYSLFFLIIIVSLYYTSIKPKIAFQTSEWPPSRHQWMVSSQLLAYLEFSKLDGIVPVLSLCANNRMDGLNFISYDWQPDVVNLKERIYNGQRIDSAEFYKVVNKYNYKYITTDYTCLRTLSKKGKNEAIFLMTELNKNLSRSYSFTNYKANMLRTYNTK